MKKRPILSLLQQNRELERAWRVFEYSKSEVGRSVELVVGYKNIVHSVKNAIKRIRDFSADRSEILICNQTNLNSTLYSHLVSIKQACTCHVNGTEEQFEV